MKICIKNYVILMRIELNIDNVFTDFSKKYRFLKEEIFNENIIIK